MIWAMASGTPPGLRLHLEEILPEQRNVEAFEAFEVDHHFSGVGRRVIHLNALNVFRTGNHAEHVLITFYDVTQVREGQIKAERAATVMQTIVDTVRGPLVILDADLTIAAASRNFVRIFGEAEADVLGKRIEDLKQRQWDITPLQQLLARVVPDEAPFEDFLVEDDFPGLGHRVFKLNARKIHVPGNHVAQLCWPSKTSPGPSLLTATRI